MLERITDRLTHLRSAASQVRYFVLNSVAAEKSYGEDVLALAKRIKLSGWFDPPSAGAQLPAAHSLSYWRLLPWDQAKIKLTIAKFLWDVQQESRGKFRLPAAEVLQVTLFGTCGREKDPGAVYTDDYITGFELRGRHFAFTKPLHFVQGTGVELGLD